MVEPLFLDFSIGLILFISLWIFYELTVIFYVMMHIHTVLLFSIAGILTNFWAAVYQFIFNPLWVLVYIIPFTIQFLLAASCIICRASLNETISVLDVIFICVIPGIMAFFPFVFADLQRLTSKDAQYNIYKDFFGVFGLISNTLILIFGGLIALYIL